MFAPVAGTALEFPGLSAHTLMGARGSPLKTRSRRTTTIPLGVIRRRRIRRDAGRRGDRGGSARLIPRRKPVQIVVNHSVCWGNPGPVRRGTGNGGLRELIGEPPVLTPPRRLIRLLPRGRADRSHAASTRRGCLPVRGHSSKRRPEPPGRTKVSPRSALRRNELWCFATWSQAESQP